MKFHWFKIVLHMQNIKYV